MNLLFAINQCFPHPSILHFVFLKMNDDLVQFLSQMQQITFGHVLLILLIDFKFIFLSFPEIKNSLNRICQISYDKK